MYNLTIFKNKLKNILFQEFQTKNTPI